MKIAIIGSGISGMTCAHLLAQQHDVVLLEKEGQLGGHTATKQITIGQRVYPVDTGFIVFNDRTYPLFTKLLARIGITRQPTEMSFSVVNDELNLQYNGHSLNSLFAQRRNLIRPWFYRFISEIIRFNKLAKQACELGAELSVGEFLDQQKFSLLFSQNYLLPMAAAIWSTSLNDIRQFSMRFFARFFNHHGLLDITNRPQWYVIPGGSSEYIKPLLKNCQEHIRLNSEVTSIKRSKDGVTLTCADNWRWQGDEVIFACHSNQALAILGDDASAQEKELLQALRYQSNEVFLHQDESLLPSIEKARASWNYRITPQGHGDDLPASVSYYMNRLQGFHSELPFVVTLNPSEAIDSATILGHYQYDHPLFDCKTSYYQGKRHLINGHNHSWYCGAYWYNGFHEDGVRSANDVVESLTGTGL
ncbi:NAD(P)/FAD-dependent oxidoreductase [Celerinatantimonas sp. MCCC 1A17872]|uniref:NAD(P)/FAD-dependent oxidoreductase n=1 Tax=Celerinatantimonas sp. MCCC 1A17872 TaxID=3177514 RepID=UPI0038C5BE90